MDGTVGLIVAAGRGHRLPGDRPKQYRDLRGRSVLRRSIDALLAHAAVERIQVVYHPADDDLYHDAVAGLGLAPPVAGGATRQQSVACGLAALAASGPAPRTVLIHDGARPIVPPVLIDRVLAALGEPQGAIPAVPVSDTLKQAQGGLVSATLERTGLWRAQTPQAFDFAAIREAHRALSGNDLSDDAAVAEAAGMSVALVAGAEENIKITTEEDLARAGRWLAAAFETRVGSGFDVHRFGPGDRVRLGGVDIAHDRALAGHSDADVVLHAVTDAILGAIGEGDIGSHFPPDDPAWRNADSRRFLLQAAQLMATRDGHLIHIDITIICERPAIAPHRADMIANLSHLLGLAADRVSIKATTTEGLGFTGRGEGIAAQATATLALPGDRGSGS